MQTKCAAFWKHTNIRNNNNIFPCCRYKTPVATFTGNIIEILNSDEYKKLRQDSDKGIYNPNCEKCYYEETLGKKSLRQKFNEEYDTEIVEIKFLELGLDNICNLTCDGCFGDFSSSWSEKQNPDKPRSFHIRTSTDIDTIPESVDKILFLGGEPLMTKRHLKILEKISNKRDVTIVYNTNGTFLLDIETKKQLLLFKKVEFIVSIDGYGDLNDKVRSGSNWSQILNFINEIKNIGFNITIHSVLHLNNWHGFLDLKKFVDKEKLNWTVNVLTYPKHLDIANTIEPTKVINLIKELKLKEENYIVNHIRQGILVDYNSYENFSKIKELVSVIEKEMLVYDYKNAFEHIWKLPKDIEATTPSWHILESSPTVGLVSSNESIGEKETIGYRPDDTAAWLTLFLHEQNKKIMYNPFVDDCFIESKKKIKELDLQDLIHVSVHFMEPNYSVPRHTDDGDINSIVYTVNLSKENPEGYVVYINDEMFTFKNKDYFSFRPQIQHRVDNFTNDMWLGILIRISKTGFKN